MGTAVMYGRSARKVGSDVVFQVMVYVTGIQVRCDNGGEVRIDLGGKVL